jgi:hypothetical protein
LFINLSDEIQQCGKRIDLGLVDAGRLNTLKKPYVQFGVERQWKPERVDVLFVAESPPCTI